MKRTTTTLASALALFLSLVQPVLARSDDGVRNESQATAKQDPKVKPGSKDDIDAIGDRDIGGGRGLGNWYSLETEIRMGRESHAYYLGNLRHDINDLGRMLRELEQAKPQASEAQQMAIERAQPHLVALANETSEALNLLRAGRENLWQAQYKETIADLSRQADILYQTVDTIVNYHNADDRLDKLEPSHSGSGS
jgi:hypothetical protein